MHFSCFCFSLRSSAHAPVHAQQCSSRSRRILRSAFLGDHHRPRFFGMVLGLIRSTTPSSSHSAERALFRIAAECPPGPPRDDLLPLLWSSLRVKTSVATRSGQHERETRHDVLLIIPEGTPMRDTAVCVGPCPVAVPRPHFSSSSPQLGASSQLTISTRACPLVRLRCWWSIYTPN
jgi:hypothetical protein